MKNKKNLVLMSTVCERKGYCILAVLSNVGNKVPADEFKILISQINNAFEKSGVKVQTILSDENPDFITTAAIAMSLQERAERQTHCSS